MIGTKHASILHYESARAADGSIIATASPSPIPLPKLQTFSTKLARAVLSPLSKPGDDQHHSWQMLPPILSELGKM
jgi:hypothetical protein